MKRLAVATLTLACAVGAFAQGNINFNNITGFVAPNGQPVFGPFAGNPTREVHGPTNVVDYTGASRLSGSNFIAQLWAGPAATGSNGLSFLAQAAFRTAAAQAGFWNGIVVSIPGVDAGGIASVQVRVFDNTTLGGTAAVGASAWDAVWQSANSGVLRGASDIFQSLPLTVPPNPPANLTGFQAFNVHAVPEPSVVALGVLGLGALLLRRKK